MSGTAKKTNSEAQSARRGSRGGLSVLRYAQIFTALLHHEKLKALIRRLAVTRRDAIGVFTLLYLQTAEDAPGGDLSH